MLQPVIRLCLMLLGWWCLWTVPRIEAAIIVATSCEEDAVQAALNAAVSGDTVQVPAGNCEWTTQVVMASTKALTMEGAGIDVTTITDRVSKSNPALAALQINLAAGGNKRVHGFTFYGATQLGSGGPGLIQVSGTGNNPSIRLDHNKFYRPKTLSITTTGSTIGVIDHNNFDLLSANAIRTFHSAWQGIGTSGHNSFAQPHSMGTDQAMFIEDNQFTWTGPPQSIQAMNDPHVGARVVIRYNTITNGYLASHGTEAQANRSPRQWEVYNNTFSGNTFTNMFIRGGPGVIFNNTSTGYPNGPIIEHYRIFDDGGPPYGICDGRNLYDDNEPGGPFESGTVTSASGYTFTDTSKSWSAGQWAGYSVRNVTLGRSSGIQEHTSNSITVLAPSNDPAYSFAAGHTYQLWKANQCMDMAGLGEADPQTGSGTSTVTPQSWNNAIVEGLYFWGNTMNGSAETIVNRRTSWMRPGIHILTTAKPGYTPYTYPHPLVSPPPPEPTQTLIAYWPLNDGPGSTIAADNTDGANDGTLVGLNPATVWQGGKYGGGLHCDGTGYVDFGDIPEADFATDQDMTVLFWARTTAPRASLQYPMLIQKHDTGTPRDEWEAFRSAAGETATWYVRVRLAGTIYQLDGSQTFSDGRWHLMGWQREGTTIRMFEDGRIADELTDPALNGAISNASPLRLCRSNFNSPEEYWYVGDIDEVQIYDYALSLQEVREKYGVHKVKRGGRVRVSGGREQ